MTVIRKTKTVNAILKTFNESSGAISIVELVNKFDGVMDKTTVYRILNRLEKSEILHSFISADGLKRYAKCGTDACLSDDSEIDMCVENSNSNNEMKIHPHFLCNDCGISLCLPVKIIVPEIPNYKVESAEQLLTGKCENCS